MLYRSCESWLYLASSLFECINTFYVDSYSPLVHRLTRQDREGRSSPTTKGEAVSEYFSTTERGRQLEIQKNYEANFKP